MKEISTWLKKIKLAPGNKVIAIVGAGHVPGIKKEIDREHDLTVLIKIPSTSNYIKVLIWGIPLAVIAIIASTFTYSPPTGFEQIVQWFLWNGSLSALGALIASAHPLSILTAFAAAPFSSLNPLLAAGWFAGIAEALIRRPRVEDFEGLGNITTLKDFFRNRVTKILPDSGFCQSGKYGRDLYRRSKSNSTLYQYNQSLKLQSSSDCKLIIHNP